MGEGHKITYHANRLPTFGEGIFFPLKASILSFISFIVGQSKPLKYDPITEEGNMLEDEDKAKEYIAQYFDNIYQAREGTPE